MSAEESPEVGRPTKFLKKYVKQAYQLCLLGMIDKEIAEFFGVVESTLYYWKNSFPEFSKAMREGKTGADLAVVNALRKRAIGYKVKEVTYEKTGDLTLLEKEGEGVAIQVPEFKKRVVLKEMPGDVMAQHLWLKNRHPKLWRDRKEVDLKTSGPMTFIYGEQAGNQPLEDE